MPDLSSPLVWALGLAAALCIGLSKTGFGGLGIVSVSLFAQLFPAKASTGALLPLMIFADFFGVYFYRRHANWKDLARLFPSAFAGILCGWWIMPRIPDRQFTVMLGWLILALMALTVLARRYPGRMRRAADHPMLGLAAGIGTGLATMLANAAGAITAFYFLARRMDKMTFVGTTAWFYLIVNLDQGPVQRATRTDQPFLAALRRPAAAGRARRRRGRPPPSAPCPAARRRMDHHRACRSGGPASDRVPVN